MVCACASLDRLSDTLIRLTITLAAVGVMTCGMVFAANNPVPSIGLPLVPAVAVPGGAGFTLTVNGAGFVNGSVVNWNSSPRTTTFVSAAQVTAAILASDIATAGTAAITVSNPAPGGGNSSVAYFAVTTPVSSVTVAGVQVHEFANLNSPTIADLNNDGKLDLVVFLENQEGENPYVVLGNGDGTFQSPLPIVGGLVESARDFVLADFNKDGNLDIALRTCCAVPSTISILLGNGDGTFQPPTFTGSQTNTVYVGLAVGDFNQDGNLDIVTNYANPPDAGISVLSGNGDGSFQPPVNYLNPYAGLLLVGDFNGDGLLDLLIQQGGNNPGAVTATMFGNGDGTFQSPVSSGNGLFLQSASAADVNGDGKLDLITWFFDDEPSFFDVSAGVSLGDGGGAFSGGAGVVGFPAFPPGDFNGDGKLDFVISSGVRFPPTDDLFIAPGNGDGTVGTAVPIVTTTGLSLAPLSQGDFNGDGAQDLLAEDSKGGFWLFLQGSFLVGNASPAILNFGGQAVGTTGFTQTVTFRNTGTGMLTLSPISVSGPDASEFKQTNTCPTTLAIGASCQINVKFVAVDSGAHLATLEIANNGIGDNAVPLLGVGADFSASAPSPDSVTVVAGQAASYTFEVEPQGGFTGTVSLSCDGVPTGAKCTLPASIELDGLSNARVVVTVTTTARANALKRGMFPGNGRWLACGLFGLPLIVSFTGVGLRRRGRHAHRRILLLVVTAILLIPACGGGGGGGAAGTPAGTYLLTVVCKYTTAGVVLTHTTSLTLVVE